MGIENRANRTASGQRGNRFHQRIGAAGGSSINEHDAVVAGLCDHVRFSRQSDDEQVVAQLERAGPVGCCLRPRAVKAKNRSAQSDSGGAARHNLQQMSTCLKPTRLLRHDVRLSPARPLLYQDSPPKNTVKLGLLGGISRAEGKEHKKHKRRKKEKMSPSCASCVSCVPSPLFRSILPSRESDSSRRCWPA